MPETKDFKTLKKMKLVDLDPDELQILTDEADRLYTVKEFTDEKVASFMKEAVELIVSKSGQRLTSNEIREICIGTDMGDKRNGRIILQHFGCHPLVKTSREDNFRVDADQLRSLADTYGVVIPTDYVTAPDIVKTVKTKTTTEKEENVTESVTTEATA